MHNLVCFKNNTFIMVETSVHNLEEKTTSKATNSAHPALQISIKIQQENPRKYLEVFITTEDCENVKLEEDPK